MRRLSQQALGNELEVTFQQIQKYESGKNRIAASQLFILAQMLKVPVEEFFRMRDLKNKAR